MLDKLHNCSVAILQHDSHLSNGAGMRLKSVLQASTSARAMARGLPLRRDTIRGFGAALYAAHCILFGRKPGWLR